MKERYTKKKMKLNSWEWDHNCNTGNLTTYGKNLEAEETFDTDGIQGRHIVEYSEQRRPKVRMLPNYICGVVSKDTVVVQYRGFSVSLRK